jgi:hypothetical protein
MIVMAAKKISSPKALIFESVSTALVCALLAGCGGSNRVEAPQANDFSRGNKPTAVAVLPPAPRIESINYITSEDGKHLVEVVGSGFESGAVAEIVTAHGSVIGSADLVGGKVRGTAALSGALGDVGAYEVRVKNPDGQQSNAASLSVVSNTQEQPPTNTRRCAADLSGSPMTLYLGGGDAAALFDQYIAQDADNVGKLPYRMKVKFYEQGESELVLQVVSLGEFEDLFVESRNDFIERLRKRLSGRTAAVTPTLKQDAMREKAQYFQCETDNNSVG